jgi:hypothetical protein
MQIEHEPMSINMTIICCLFYFRYRYLVPNIVILFKVWQLFLIFKNLLHEIFFLYVHKGTKPYVPSRRKTRKWWNKQLTLSPKTWVLKLLNLIQ